LEVAFEHLPGWYGGIKIRKDTAKLKHQFLVVHNCLRSVFMENFQELTPNGLVVELRERRKKEAKNVSTSKQQKWLPKPLFLKL